MTFQIGEWVYFNNGGKDAYKDEWFIKITNLIGNNGHGTGYGIFVNNKTINVYRDGQGNFGFHRKNPPLWQYANLPFIDEDIIIPPTGKQYLKELLTYLANKH